jgi:hypothetical protein
VVLRAGSDVSKRRFAIELDPPDRSSSPTVIEPLVHLVQKVILTEHHRQDGQLGRERQVKGALFERVDLTGVATRPLRKYPQLYLQKKRQSR